MCYYEFIYEYFNKNLMKIDEFLNLKLKNYDFH